MGEYPFLVGHRGFEIISEEDYTNGQPGEPRGRKIIRTVVKPKAGEEEPKELVFIMMKAEIGMYKGCWLTHRLLPGGSDWIGLL